MAIIYGRGKWISAEEDGNTIIGQYSGLLNN